MTGSIASKVFAAFVHRKFYRVPCIPFILAKNPVHLVAEVVQRVALQMNNPVPTTNAAGPILLHHHVDERSGAVRHPFLAARWAGTPNLS